MGGCLSEKGLRGTQRIIFICYQRMRGCSLILVVVLMFSKNIPVKSSRCYSDDDEYLTVHNMFHQPSPRIMECHNFDGCMIHYRWTGWRTAIRRSCGSAVKPGESVCTTVDKDDGPLTYCNCNHDLCNKSPSMSASTIIVIFSIIFFKYI